MKKTKTRSDAALAAERDAEALFASSGLAGVLDAAWESVTEKTRLRALEAIARREAGGAGLGRSFEVFDWARKEGFCRHNLRLDHELDLAAVGLATRGDPRIVPFVIGLVERSWVGAHLLEPWITTDRVDAPRLVASARRWIASDRPSIDELELAAKILERFSDAGDSAAIADAFDRLLATVQQPLQGFDTAITRNQARVTIALLARALVACGAPASLLPALSHALLEKHYPLDDLRGHAALVLASTGSGLELLERSVAASVTAGDEKKIRSGMFGALAQLATKTSPERREAVRARIAALPEQKHPLAESARLAALRDLGDDSAKAPFVDALARALGAGGKDDADGFEGPVAALEMLEKREDVPASLAEPLVRSESIAVHRTAVRVLRSRRAPVPDYRIVDPIAARDIVLRGDEAVRDALADERNLFRETVVLALGDAPAPSLREPLVSFARWLAAHGKSKSEQYGLRWTVAALAKMGGAEAVFDELLHADDDEVVESVIRNEHGIERGVERGMAHVLSCKDPKPEWMRATAARWLRRHPTPETVTALGERGLALEDLKLLAR